MNSIRRDIRSLWGRIAAMGLAAALLAGCVNAPVTEPAELPAGEWQLDTRHVSVIWGARHFGLSWARGRFDRVDATLNFDPERPEASQLTAIVETASVSTGLEEFDQALRGTPWLAAERNPQIRFQSTGIEVTGERRGRVTGELTLRGVTREEVMDVQFFGGNYNFLEGRQAVGFAGDMTIDRRDYEVGNLPATIAGNEVRIQIEADFLRSQ